MKKLLLLLVSVILTFSIIGCVEIVTTTTEEEWTTEATTTTNTTTQFTGSTTEGTGTTTDALTTTTTTRPVVYGDLPDEEVEITFWHIYGSGKTALLDQIIAEFEGMFPNVTITSTSQSDYNTLREKIQLGITVGMVPTLALGYPDHFANYIDAGAAYSLDPLISSDIVYEITDSSSSIFGETVTTSLDLTDFVPSYLAENNQYTGHHYYSVPYSKSTETMAVNVDVLKAHVAEIRALGITISDNGYLSHEVPLTLNQLNQLSAIMVSSLVDGAGDPISDVANNKCAYLVNYDSSGNMFINMSRELGAPYTNSSGDILVDNAATLSMLTYLNTMFQNRTMVLPSIWDASYGSTNFIYGDVCMSVGSTAGVNYNIPANNLPADLAKLQFGAFATDFVPVPQAVTANNQAVTVYAGTTPFNFTGNLSAVQQGPNIGIFKDTSSAERIYAWLFIKYLTNTDNTARWAMDTGYLPARLSAYTSEVPIQLTGTFSTTYNDFLQISLDFWATDGNPGWNEADERWDFLYKSMVANIARYQNDYYQYDPAFAAGSNSAGSATARVEAGYCLENIVTGAYSPATALQTMKSQLTW
ncbi:MAG: extracellular solute-binding protein [Bacillota bacterium]|nr:extracellular solute-binding protein [Bacillota bacterium]